MKKSERWNFVVRTGLFPLLGLTAACSPAFANDGGIAYGGSPCLLKGHPSVSMTSEVIRITVGDNGLLTADCQFVFTNHGAACKVRMGFPDEGEGVFDPDEKGEERVEDVMKTPPKTTFTSFHSYVDGMRVPTKLIRAAEQGKYWHTKTVTFPAHSVRRIRDVYTQPIGISVFSSGKRNGYHPELGYILHTGASWHGPIGRSEINVTFRCKKITGVIQPLSLRLTALDDTEEVKPSALARNVVVWKGPCKPTIKGKTLQFVRTHWTPKESDDIWLGYDYDAGK